MRTGKPAVCFLILILSLIPSYATAALIWDFEVNGTELSGSGHFEVDAATPGTLTNFSYSGSLFGHNFNVGLANILAPDWTINEADWTLSHIAFSTNRIISEDAEIALVFRLFTDRQVFGASADCFSSRLSPGPNCGGEFINDTIADVVTFTPSHTAPVPEPGTMALLGSGLFGLAAYRWHQRRREGEQTA